MEPSAWLLGAAVPVCPYGPCPAGGCLQEIFGAGGVSSTGLPGPPGSAQLGTVTGRSCLISPSPPGLVQADPVA